MHGGRLLAGVERAAVTSRQRGPRRRAVRERGAFVVTRHGLPRAEDIDRAELESFLVAKRAWIYKKLAEKESLHYEPVTKELVDGEGYLYLGRATASSSPRPMTGTFVSSAAGSCSLRRSWGTATRPSFAGTAPVARPGFSRASQTGLDVYA